MELGDYLAPLRRWWWLILASILIAMTSAFYFTRELPPVYLARTTLLVGRALTEANPTEFEFGLGRTLARAYASVAVREPIANGVKSQLGLTELPKYTANPTPDGQFLEILVTDSSPELAQRVANAIAEQIIKQSPGVSQDAERQAFVESQLEDIRRKIENTTREIAQAQEKLSSVTSAAALDSLQSEIRTLEQRLTTLQSNYATLLANTAQGASNILTVFEPAALPERPIGPNVTLIILAAGLAGLVLSTGAAYLIEFLDDTLKTSDDVNRLLPYPIVGYIGEMERGRAGLVPVIDRPHSAIADAFRSLRTNLEFAAVDKPFQVIQITSASKGEGKSSIAFNLALIIAQRGKRVVLLDCDLRRPAVHRLLGMPNHDGLSDLFLGKLNVQDVTRVWRDNKLVAITGGTPPPNPTELLGSKRMDQILAELRENYDVIVIDGPPFFVPDAWVLTAKVDAVLLVAQPGFTRRSLVRAMVEQLKRVHAPVGGVVINRLSAARAGEGRFSYVSYYYYDKLWSERRKQVSAKGPFGLRLPASLRFWPKALPANGNKPPPANAPAANGHRVAVLPPAPVPDTERSRVTLDLLYALSHELASQMDLRELMERILRMTLESVGATSGSIIAVNEVNEPLEGILIYDGKAQTHTPEQLREVVQQGLAGWVIENRRPVKLDNTLEDSRWLRRDWDEGSGTPRSAICVPLMNNDRVVGVLTLVHPDVNYFTRDDLSMVTAIAVGISLSRMPALLRGNG
ncbi:MAG: polysaccharide biosynthesis tyrosine autokinase [Anaerolineales bacterium]|nr:polysaccharide biosynthesis tyrosine autokinase [Anaerolineales bacterium]